MKIILPICPQTWFKQLPEHSKYFTFPEKCEQKSYEVRVTNIKLRHHAIALINKYWANSLKTDGRKLYFTAFKELTDEYFEGMATIKKTASQCEEYIRDGKCRHCLSGHGLRIKQRIERYKEYKEDLRTLARQQYFQLPNWGFKLYFFFPIPDYWTVKKTKAFHGQPKLSKPDIDNLEKAFYDALSITDETVAELSGHGKYWFDPAQIQDPALKGGYIEILLNTPVYNPFGVTFIDQKAFDRQPKRKWVRKNKPKEKNQLV